MSFGRFLVCMLFVGKRKAGDVVGRCEKEKEKEKDNGEEERELICDAHSEVLDDGCSLGGRA